MRTVFSFVLIMFAMTAAAGDLASIAGRYHYEDYSVTLPNGRTLTLAELGATDATLNIAADGRIQLHMQMKNGQSVDQTATVVEGYVAAGRGYWLAQWPDMTYPVRAVFSLKDGILTTVTKFDQASDPQRYGSVERATLKKL
jgi:hypothetical protein